MNSPLDLTGQRYGMLVVKRRAPDIISGVKKKRKVAWYCDCDCGTKDCIVTTDNLRLTNNATKSCGCLSKKTQFKPQRNKYEIKDDCAIFYTKKNEEIYVDKDDIDIVKQHTWYINGGYACDRDGIFMHRLIMNAPKDKDVDHINHNKLDNRKSNLRIVTAYENMWNKGIHKNNSTGVTGVSRDKQCNKWHAYIMCKGKQINLGYFKNFDDAVAARKEAEKKYFGEFNYDYSMKVGA